MALGGSPGDPQILNVGALTMPQRVQREIAAAIATGALRPVFADILQLKVTFIALVLGCWVPYLAVQAWKRPSVLAEWGFSTVNLKQSFIATALLAAGVLTALAAVASRRGGVMFHWHMLPLLFLYPVWGLFQQLLVQGVVVRPLVLGVTPVVPRATAIAVSAALFGAIHLPDARLAAATAVMGLVFTPLYLRWNNLWPLGLFHGWLGVAFYFWYLGRDPWTEFFQGSA